jgi:predicted ester cyclase
MILSVLTSLTALLALNTIQAEEILPEPKSIILGRNETPESSAQEILAARRYAAFWNTGDESFVEKALDPDFMDRTLPNGRQQGINGPIEASRIFRAAIPDLTVMIEKMIVADDHVILHLNFEGHFLGTLEGIQGKGEKISFIATDIYKIENGKITDNWHIEDVFTLFLQMEIVNILKTRSND